MPAFRRVLSRLDALPRARPRHFALAALALGLAAAAAPPGLRAAIAAGALAALAWLRVPRLGLVCAALLLLGGAIGTARLHAIDAHGRSLRSGDGVEGRAHLLERPRPTRFGWRAEVRLSSGHRRGARLLARAGRELRPPRGARVGSEIALRGRVRHPHRRRGERFDFAAYLKRRGIGAELWLSRAEATGGSRGGTQGFLDSMRRRAGRAVSAGLSPETAALVRGMVLGEDDLVDESTREDWRASGLAHLLAVSGQNVMLLAALALPLLALAGLPATARTVATAALIALYVPLAGAGPSLQRAAVMGIASLAALTLARPSSRGYALILAAGATLALNPRAWGDPGWQLSFAAVAGILLLAPGLRRGPLRALPHVLGDGIAVTVAATLATAPMLAYSFGSVPLVGLPANVLALPLVAPIMWLGMLRAALGQLLPSAPGAAAGPLAFAATTLNDALGAALGPLTESLDALARTFAELPGGQLELAPFPSVLLVGAYAALGGAAFGARRVVRRFEPRLAAAAAGWRRMPRARRTGIVCALVAVVTLVLVRALAPPGPPAALTVSFLDVGQGDATLVQHPDGTAVLFDGGPPEGRVDRLLRRAGVRRLSALVMTHASRDHHGGLREVARRYPIDVLIDGGDGTRDAGFNAIVTEALRRGARRVEGVAPLTLSAGALRIRLLGPPRRPPGPAPQDPNGRAIVAVISAGAFDLLLSADAESPSLAPLRLPRVEVMKVPHHGSRDPGLPEVLRRLRPSLAGITVGENDYGHPAPSTLAALERAGVRTHRTDREGTIRITVRDEVMHVRSERPGAVAGAP